MPSRRTLLPVGVLLSLIAPAAACAEVPHANGVYSPRTGAELVEAVKAVSALQLDSGSNAERIELRAQTYEISETLVLTGRRAVTLAGPSDGDAVITNAASEPQPLLRAYAQSRAFPTQLARVKFVVSGQSADAFAAVEIFNGARADRVAVTVPASTPKATGLRLAAGRQRYLFDAMVGARAVDVSVVSDAASAPGVSTSPASALGRLRVDGGNPSLRVADDADLPWSERPAVATAAVGTANLTARQGTRRLIDVVPGTGRIDAHLAPAVLDGKSFATRLIDVADAAGDGGSADVTLQGITAIGGANSTLLRVGQGKSTTPTKARLDGVVTVGSSAVLDCPDAVTTWPRSVVSFAGIYREGGLAVGGCDVSEKGRATADPKFFDRGAGDLRVRWGSSLIDRLLPGETSAEDILGASRFVRPDEPFRESDALGDLGAHEYRYTPPVIEDWAWAPYGSRGLVKLAAIGRDSDLQEDREYGVTYRWIFGDGATADGPVVAHRFGSNREQHSVTLIVIDASGMTVQETIEIRPWIFPCDPATDDEEYEPVDVCPAGGPRPVPTPQPTLLPRVTPTPRATPRLAPTLTPKPQSTPKPLAATLSTLEIVRSRASLRSRRSTESQAAARANEAAVRLHLTRPTAVVYRVERKVGAKYVRVSKASLRTAAPAGWHTVRITPRFGKARLREGLYRVNVAIAATSQSPAESRSFGLRITK